MCLQVVVAALYYNPPVLLDLLQKPLPNADSTILAHFIKQWLNDADCFLGYVFIFCMITVYPTLLSSYIFYLHSLTQCTLMGASCLLTMSVEQFASTPTDTIQLIQ